MEIAFVKLQRILDLDGVSVAQEEDVSGGLHLSVKWRLSSERLAPISSPFKPSCVSFVAAHAVKDSAPQNT
jgi:hypothetical protein